MKQKTIAKILLLMMKSKNFRVGLARISHFWFFNCYFAHYIVYPTADFQKEIFQLTENDDSGMIVITAFRGSAKSTICTLSYPLWAILGTKKKKFIVITSQTQRQARQILLNIKRELEQNLLLKADLGPFKEEADEWGGFSLVVPNYGAKIMAASCEQGIRGMRHMQYRPDVILGDDIEDLQSVRTQEARDKTYDWLKGDILPAGGPNLKVIIIGNLLHEDSLLKRLQEEIESKSLKGIYKEYPLLSKKGKINWPGKFHSQEEIEKEKGKLSDESAWQREFLLNIIPAEDQIIKKEWIHYYDYDKEFPSYRYDNYSWTTIAIDLAISEKQSADCTAMVIGSLFGRYHEPKLYIHPFPINKRMDFPSAREMAKQLANTANPSKRSKILVEEVAYQAALTQQLKQEWYDAVGVKVGSSDKRTKISLISHLIKNGMILFPKKGCEELINQLVYFGVEKHDDLADAFTILANYALESMRQTARPIIGKFNKI